MTVTEHRGGRVALSLRDRLLRSHRVEDRGYETPCWIWTLASYPNGYPMMRVGSLTDDSRRTRPAHRVSYEEFVGPIADELEVDHLCFVPLCINPAHLEAVTPLENTQRAAARVTHCPQGHAYDAENTYTYPGTKIRKCRACGRDRARGARERKADVRLIYDPKEEPGV